MSVQGFRSVAPVPQMVELHILDSLDDTHATVVNCKCHANDVASSN